MNSLYEPIQHVQCTSCTYRYKYHGIQHALLALIVYAYRLYRVRRLVYIPIYSIEWREFPPMGPGFMYGLILQDQ